MKLYVCVRKDLSHGARVAQSCHAAIDFGIKHPSTNSDWHTRSNTIVCLGVDSTYDLFELANDCESEGIEYVLVREPDLDDEPTAIAIAPAGAKLTRALKLVA